MGVQWFKMRSWHAIKFESRGGIPKAYCGRWAPSVTTKTVDDRPPGEKSCESCLRLIAPK